MKIRLIAVSMMLCLSACSEAPFSGKTVALDQVPANLIEIAQKQVPGLKLESAFMFESGGKKIYEIRGKNNKGKLIEVEVDEDGKVVAIE